MKPAATGELIVQRSQALPAPLHAGNDQCGISPSGDWRPDEGVINDLSAASPISGEFKPEPELEDEKLRLPADRACARTLLLPFDAGPRAAERWNPPPDFAIWCLPEAPCTPVGTKLKLGAGGSKLAVELFVGPIAGALIIVELSRHIPPD